jgi:hypothetical protein
MTEPQAQELLDKIIGQIFGFKNPYSLDDFKTKYAFDLRLPIQVNDGFTGEETYAQSVNPTKFMTQKNTFVFKIEGREDWMQPKQDLKNIEDILRAWEPINFTTTERQIDSLNVSKSDNVTQSENVYYSLDIHNSKNILLCDGIYDGGDHLAASARSQNSTYSARLEDSQNCSNSFSISWSANIANSMFIHDAYGLYECLFCSHMRDKKFCVANMQFEEAEYFKIKEMVSRWVLTS